MQPVTRSNGNTHGWPFWTRQATRSPASVNSIATESHPQNPNKQSQSQPQNPAHDEILATRSVGTFEPRTYETFHIPENLAVTSIRARQGDPILLVRPVADDPDGISISVGDCCGSTPLQMFPISNRQAHCQPTATHPGVGTRARDRTVEDLAWLETSWHLDLKWLVGVGVDDLHDVPFLYTRRDLNFYDLQKLRPLSDCG